MGYRIIMISTVTTTTVTTVTTTALAASLSLVAVIALLVLLIQKEVLSGAETKRAQTLSRVLNVVVIPLLLSFGFIVFVNVSQLLR